MEMVTRASIEIPRPLEKVFDLAVDMGRAHELMTKTGPIPGVVKIEMDGGQPPRTGATRRVTMTDKSIIGEEIVALDRPSRHAYRWLNPPAPPFSLLVRGAEADWRFSSAGEGTRVEWTYRFRLSTFLIYPLAAIVIALFRRWMVNTLENLKTAG